MKHVTFFLFIWTILTLEIKAQYNYKNFKYPDVTVKGLNVGLFLNGIGTSYTVGRNEKTYNLAYHLDANYFRFVNTTGQQKTDNIVFNNNLEKNSSNIYQENYVNFYLEKSQINRKYINNETKFFGLEGRFFELNHKIAVTKSFSRFDYFNTALILSGGIGIGRIQPASEVFNAQFLMEDLMQQGLLNQKFSEEELFELAALMAKIKNTRVFDYRRANIFQLKELNKWLTSKGLIQDITLFTIINDNWTNNLVNQRMQGAKFSFNLNPWAKITRADRGNDDIYGVAAIISFVSAHNFTQHIGSETAVGIRSSFDSSDSETANPIYISGSHQLLINPNSRTIFGFGPALSVQITDLEYYGFLLSMRGSCSYFINNQARISGNIVFSRNQGSNPYYTTDYPYIDEFNDNFKTNTYYDNLLTFYEYPNYSVKAYVSFSYSFF